MFFIKYTPILCQLRSFSKMGSACGRIVSQVHSWETVESMKGLSVDSTSRIPTARTAQQELLKGQSPFMRRMKCTSGQLTSQVVAAPTSFAWLIQPYNCTSMLACLDVCLHYWNLVLLTVLNVVYLLYVDLSTTYSPHTSKSLDCQNVNARPSPGPPTSIYRFSSTNRSLPAFIDARAQHLRTHGTAFSKPSDIPSKRHQGIAAGWAHSGGATIKISCVAGDNWHNRS